MGLLDRLGFKRTATSSAVQEASAQVGLFSEQAVDHLVAQLTRLQDPDEVLKQAGVRREMLQRLMYDDEIAQAFETRLDALLAVPMRLEPSEGDAAVKIEAILKPFLRDALAGVFNARPYGYSVLEAVYSQEDGYIGLSYLAEKPFNWFEPRNDGTLRYFPADGSGGGAGVEVDQEYKFFLTRNRPTYKNPYGEALLSRLYWAWYFRTNGWKFWGKWLERFGSPLMVGKSGDPAKMVQALLLAHHNAAIGIGKEDEVSAVGAPSGNNGQAFESFEASVVRRIQKVVLGQTLTSGTDNGSGNRALGQVHETVRMDKRNSDIALVEATMQRVVDALCKLNGWEKHLIQFADGVGLEQARSERDKNLFAIGVRFEPNYFEDNYDLRAEDFTVQGGPDASGATPPQPGDGGAPNQGNESPDASGTPNTDVQATSKVLPPHLFTQFASSGKKFTAKQQEIENLADTALNVGSPISPELVRAAVIAAENPQDLEQRLYALVGEAVNEDTWAETLERALFAADVLGYVHAEK